jgi:GxxExxY protein
LAIGVHKNPGPEFLESVYEDAFCIEPDFRGIHYQRQMEIDIEYKGHFIKGQRLDLIAEDSVIVENKVVGEVLPIHKMALLSYLNAAQTRAG